MRDDRGIRNRTNLKDSTNLHLFPCFQQEALQTSFEVMTDRLGGECDGRNGKFPAFEQEFRLQMRHTKMWSTQKNGVETINMNKLDVERKPVAQEY